MQRFKKLVHTRKIIKRSIIKNPRVFTERLSPPPTPIDNLSSTSNDFLQWNLTQIPKIMHVYWGGDVLPFLRYLTVHTFVKYNPDWLVKVYSPLQVNTSKPWITHELKYKVNTRDYINELFKFDNVEKIKFNFDDIGVRNVPENHKSDFLRYYLLSTVGGLWSDMDIIYLKPMNKLYFNVPQLSQILTTVCIHPGRRNYHSAGFLLASKDSDFYSQLFEFAKRKYRPLSYQGAGPDMMNAFSPPLSQLYTSYSNIFNMSMNVVYPYDHRQIREIYRNEEFEIPSNTIGVHWYAGWPGHADYINAVNENNYSQFQHILGKIVQKSMDSN